RQGQSRSRDQDDQDAGRRVRLGVEFRRLRRGDRLMSDIELDTRGVGVEAVSMTKRFGDFVALEDVSLKIPVGSFHALLGENGAGKSTLVKCIMGYYLADEGDIIVGKDVRQIRSPYDAHKLGIGMVYQHFTVVPAMSVAENLLL